jgi:hypothetical protein
LIGRKIEIVKCGKGVETEAGEVGIGGEGGWFWLGLGVCKG